MNAAFPWCFLGCGTSGIERLRFFWNRRAGYSAPRLSSGVLRPPPPLSRCAEHPTYLFPLTQGQAEEWLFRQQFEDLASGRNGLCNISIAVRGADEAGLI